MSWPDRRELAAVFAGGAVGALARAALAHSGAPAAPAWPWATFAVNIAGAAILGYVATRLQDRLPLSSYRRPLLGTGFCGAFTTFSTLQLEALTMVEADHVLRAIAYAAASIAAGYAGVHVATAAVRRVRSLA